MNVLYTETGVCIPMLKNDNTNPDIKNYIAIWDTGATHSAITSKIAKELNLKATGLVEVKHADGKSLTNTYLVNILLPNHVMVGQVKVTEVKLIKDDNISEEKSPQILIGMDIIGIGDFAVTNLNNKTILSFRIPSFEQIDFVSRANIQNEIERKKNRRIFRGKRK
ncbi:MAG: retroviral-like aspartic protease family protein [Candidatus Paceibacterota bacterium]